MIKPDGVQRGLVGEIIKRFEQKGFQLVAMKFMQVRKDDNKAHSSCVFNPGFFFRYWFLGEDLFKFESHGVVFEMGFY